MPNNDHSRRPGSAAPTPPEKAADGKSRLTAGVLGLLLGCMGAHNLYLGYTGKAVAQILIGMLGACLIVEPLISGIWGLVEAVMLFTGKINTDGKGNPLSNRFDFWESLDFLPF